MKRWPKFYELASNRNRMWLLFDNFAANRSCGPFQLQSCPHFCSFMRFSLTTLHIEHFVGPICCKVVTIRTEEIYRMHSATRLSRKYGNTSAVKPHTFSGEPKNTEVSHVKLQFQPLATGSFLEGEEAGGGQKRILFIQVSP